MDALLEKFNEKKINQMVASSLEPGWLKDFRISAFESFKSLPLEKSELFKKYINMSMVDWKSFQESENKTAPENDFILLGESRDTLFNNSALIRTPLRDDVVFLDIGSAMKKYPAVCKKYFTNKILDSNHSKSTAFTNAFFNSGFFLFVPDNKTIEEPIRIINSIDSKGSVVISQNIIIIGKNSRVTLMNEEYSLGASQTLHSSNTDIHLKDDSVLTMGDIHSVDGALELLNKKTLLERGANLKSSSGFFGGAITVSSVDHMMEGDGSSVDDFQIVFGNGQQNFSLSSNLFHIGVGTGGKVMTRGVFQEQSRGLFRGMIKIGTGAKNTNSYLAGHSVLLSKDTRADAIPGLEIENNDVRATHSASVTQISEEEIFYLMSRGFAEAEAKKLIVQGFFEPVVRQIQIPNAVPLIRGLFEIKWNHQDLSKLRKTMEKIADTEMTDKGTDIFEGHYKYR